MSNVGRHSMDVIFLDQNKWINLAGMEAGKASSSELVARCRVGKATVAWMKRSGIRGDPAKARAGRNSAAYPRFVLSGLRLLRLVTDGNRPRSA